MTPIGVKTIFSYLSSVFSVFTEMKVSRHPRSACDFFIVGRQAAHLFLTRHALSPPLLKHRLSSDAARMVALICGRVFHRSALVVHSITISLSRQFIIRRLVVKTG